MVGIGWVGQGRCEGGKVISGLGRWGGCGLGWSERGGRLVTRTESFDDRASTSLAPCRSPAARSGSSTSA